MTNNPHLKFDELNFDEFIVVFIRKVLQRKQRLECQILIKFSYVIFVEIFPVKLLCYMIGKSIKVQNLYVDQSYPFLMQLYSLQSLMTALLG